jgi:hypothetical protein
MGLSWVVGFIAIVIAMPALAGCYVSEWLGDLAEDIWWWGR